MLGGKENSSGGGGFGGFNLAGAASTSTAAPSAPKGGSTPGGFSFGALGGGSSAGSADGLPSAPKGGSKPGGFSFGALGGGGGLGDGGDKDKSSSKDPPPSAPKGGMPGGFSLSGGPKIAAPATDSAAVEPPAAKQASAGFSFGGATTAAATKPALALAKPDSGAPAKSVGFSLQPAGSTAVSKSSASSVAVVSTDGMPGAPDLVASDEKGSGSNRALLHSLRGPDFAKLLSEPGVQTRLELLTSMYSGPTVVAQDKDIQATLARTLTPRTADMRKSNMIYAHMVSAGPARKKLEAASDGRDDGWIDQLSFITNLHQKQAFQMWQLFRETMLEADHAATRPTGSRDLHLARAVMPSTVEELGAVKDPTVIQGSRQTASDTLEFYFSERLDIIRCAILALAPGASRRAALKAAGLSARQMLHTALFTLAETAEDRAGARGGEGAREQLLARWPHIGERHLVQPVERGLRLPLCAHDRTRVDPQLREREPRQQEEEHLLLLQLILQALTADGAETADRTDRHPHQDLDIMLEMFEHSKWRALPQQRQVFGTMLRCLVTMQWFCFDSAAGMQSRLRGSGVGSRGVAQRIEESIDHIAQQRIEQLLAGAARDFCHDAVPAMASLSWALCSLQQMVKAKHLIDSFTVEGEFDMREQDERGFGRTNFATLDDQTKRQRQMRRPLTSEESQLVKDAIIAGVTEDHLREEDLLSYDNGGEWPCPNPKRKIKMELLGVYEDFDRYFAKSMQQATSLDAEHVLEELVELAGVCEDEALPAAAFKDTLWRFLLGWTDPDVVIVDRQANFLALVPRTIQHSQGPIGRGPMDLHHVDCSCERAGAQLQVAVGDLLAMIEGSADLSKRETSRSASRFLHFVRYALENFSRGSEKFATLLTGMARGSNEAPLVVRDLLCTVDVPAGGQKSAGGIAVGRQRTCVLTPQGGGTTSLRVLLVHTVIYCCEHLRSSDQSTPEHANSVKTLGAWLQLLVAVLRDSKSAEIGLTDDWDAFLEEVAATHYWERYHLDLLAHLVPTTSKEPPYLISTARTGAGVGVALCAAVLRALPTIRNARTWDIEGLETATACVELLSVAAANGSGHLAFHSPNDSHGARFILAMLESIDTHCAKAVGLAEPSVGLRLQKQRGRFAVASLSFMSLLLSHLQCRTAAWNLVADPEDCVRLISHFAEHLASGLSRDVLDESRWLVAEGCATVLAQCLDTAVVSKTVTVSSSLVQDSQARLTVLQKILLPHAEDSAILDFLLEVIAQSLRWNHLLVRQARPKALAAMQRVVARTLDLLRAALSTPVEILHRHDLYPMSGTTLARRLFSMRANVTGPTNDQNTSLIDEIGELCSWNNDGSETGRDVVLAATRTMTVLCRLLGSPDFGCGETPTSAANHQKAKLNGSRSVVGDTSLGGSRTRAMDGGDQNGHGNRPVSWSIVAAIGGARACQTFVTIAETRLAEFSANPDSEELYLATLDLVDAAITSRDGLADFYVSPRRMTLVWDAKHNAGLEKKDVRAVVAKLLHAPDLAVLENDRGCKVLEADKANETVLEFATPGHLAHAERIFGSFGQFKRSIEFKRGSRVVKFSGEGLKVWPKPAGFLQELLDQLSKTRSDGDDSNQRYASGLELLYNILQHYCDYPPVVAVVLQRDLVKTILPEGKVPARRAVCVHAMALAWRVAGQCLGIAASCKKDEATKANANWLQQDIETFFQKNLEQSVDDMLAIESAPQRSLQHRLLPFGIAAQSFGSACSMVSSVVLNPQFDTRQVLAHMSFAARSRFDTGQREPTDLELVSQLWRLRSEMLALTADALCYGYGEPPLEGTQAQAEGLVWAGDDEYEQYFFQLSGPILTHYEFRDEGDLRTMRGDTKTHFHLGGSKILQETTFSVSAEHSSYRVELELAAGGQITLELHPRPREASGWEDAKDAMRRAVQDAVGYPCLYMKDLAGGSAGSALMLTDGDSTSSDAVAQDRELAVKMCGELEAFIGPLLLPCARRSFDIKTVALQGNGAPTQMGSVTIQASTAPQLVANVLAKLTARVYLASSCPGTDEEIRTQFRKYGRVRRADLCESNGIRWVQYDNFASAERARAANEPFVDGQRIKAARCLSQGASAFMRRKGSGEFSLLTLLDGDVDDEHLMLKHEPDSRADYARFLGLRSGKQFFARLTAQEHEHASELLRAMFAISIALTVKSDEAHRQKGVFQTRLATAVSSMVGVHVNLGGSIPVGVRAKLMRALQRGMLVVTRRPPTGQGHVSRLEAAASLLAFLLRCRSDGRKSEGPLGELTVYIRESGSLQSESMRARLGRMFDTIDSDASGEVDTKEGKDFLISQGVPSTAADKLWSKLLAQADSNGDGKLDKSEWVEGFFKVQAGIQGQTLASTLNETLFQTESVRHRFDKLFDKIDVDKSGTIDEREAKRFFSREGIPPAFLDQFWQDLLEKADIDSDGHISREEWGSVGADVFISAKRAGRAGFASSIVDMTMLLKGTTTARHLVAKIEKSKVQGDIEDVDQVDTSVYRECTYGLADPSAPVRIFRDMPTVGIIVRDPDKVPGLLVGMFLESVNGVPVNQIGDFNAVMARIKTTPKPLKLSMQVPEHASARVEITNRVVDMSLPAWRFSDSAKLRMSRLFDAIDSDGSGELDVDEWKSFLTEQRVDPAKHEQNWNTLMAEVDKDGDGKVSKNEFTEGWLRLFGWKAAARDVEGVFRATAIPDRSDELVMIKSAKLIQLSLGGMHVGGSDTDEDEAEKQSTLAQTLTMCKSLFEASGVTPGGVQHWALARAALVNLLTISNELAKMGERDQDGTHSHLCGRGTGHDGDVADESDARAALIERLLVKEWGERLGSDPYEASMLISGTLPSICESLKHLHHIAEDLAQSPLNDQGLRQQMEQAFRSSRNISYESASSHPMSAAEQRPPRKFTIYPCVRGGMAQAERGVFLLGDGQAAFVPESGSASTVVLMHNVTVKSSGARGLTLSLDRRGVAAGVVLEIGELLHHHETLRAAVEVRDEAVARHEVWELSLTTLAALVRQASDKPAVVASLVRFDLVRLLCARLAVLQRPEVVVHGDTSNEEAPDAWGALPSAQLGAATTRRSEADTRLALQIMDALIAIADVSTGEHRVVQLMVASEAVPVLSEFVFDDEELAAAYEPDGRRASAHILWCRILRFVATLLRIFLTELPYRGNDTLVSQLMAFIGSHQSRLGLQWSGTEVVRSIAATDVSALPKSVWISGAGAAAGRTCPALGLAKLGGTRSLTTASALLSLRSRGLTEAWLEEVEAISRLLTVVGNAAPVWKSRHPEILSALAQRLMDTVRVCTLVLQTDPVRDVAKSSARLGTDLVPARSEEGGTFGRAQGAAAGGKAASRQSSSGSEGGWGKQSRSASRRPSRHRSRQERQGSKSNEPEGQPAAEPSAEESAASSGVHTTDLFTRHVGEDQRLCTPQVWHSQSSASASTGDAGTPAEQKALAVAVNQRFLTVIQSAAHCLRALSPPPLPGRGAGASGIFSVPNAVRPEMPAIRELQQQIERFAERRCVSLLREQAQPLACYHQGSDDSLYRSVAFQLNVELHDEESKADVPWWLMADNDPEEVIEKVGMVLGLLQIFDKADVDGSGRLEEGECKDLLEAMFDDDRREVIDGAWAKLLQRVSKTGGMGGQKTQISKDEWVHIWMPPANPAENWAPLRPHVQLGGQTPRASASGRAAELQSIFRLKGVDVYQELFDELAKAAQVRSSGGGKSVDTMDADHVEKLPRALDLDRVLSKDDVAQVRKDLRLADGGQLTVAAWRGWLQGSSNSVKRIMRLKNERLADDELFDVVDQMRNDQSRFGISVRTNPSPFAVP
jgi:Ca2+-binding EF-hand superfamily protein